MYGPVSDYCLLEFSFFILLNVWYAKHFIIPHLILTILLGVRNLIPHLPVEELGTIEYLWSFSGLIVLYHEIDVLMGIWIQQPPVWQHFTIYIAPDKRRPRRRARPEHFWSVKWDGEARHCCGWFVHSQGKKRNKRKRDPQERYRLYALSHSSPSSGMGENSNKTIGL